MTVKQQEYVLFFSNYCNFSKDVVTYITRKNIRNAFVFVCVDTVSNIPSFVDRVPMITCKSTRELYVDDRIDELLEDINMRMYPPTTIEASCASFGGNEDNVEFESLAGNTEGFSMIDMDNFRISTIAENEDIKGKKANSSQLEQYIAQRDCDVKMTSLNPSLR